MHAGRAHGRPCETEEPDRLERGEPEQPFQPAFGHERVVAFFPADRVVAHEPGPVGEVGDEVSEVDRDEGPGQGEGAEVVVAAVYRAEGLEEGEDQRVGEPGEDGEEENDGLAHEHLEGSKPDLEGFFAGHAGFLELVGTVDVGVFACAAPAAGFAVDEDGGAGFRHEEMQGLHRAAEDELGPEVPAPGEEALDWAADYAPDAGADAGGKDDEC